MTAEKKDVWTDLFAETKTLTGEPISYPTKMSLGKELQIRSVVMDKLSSFSELFSGKTDETSEEKALSFFMKEIPHVIAPVVGIILEKEESWVLDNLDRKTAEEIAGPFFESFLDIPGMKALGVEAPDLSEDIVQE